jgi:hypothetical protein
VSIFTHMPCRRAMPPLPLGCSLSSGRLRPHWPSWRVADRTGLSILS